MVVPNVKITYGDCQSRERGYFFKGSLSPWKEQEKSVRPSAKEVSCALSELTLVLGNPVPKFQGKVLLKLGK